jgi:hypothetical protein
MAKKVPKITYTEGIVLADSNKTFTHIFLSESGFNVQEPPTYVPNSKNMVQFTDKAGKPIASHAINANGQKIKPSSKQLTHLAKYVYYFKKSTHKLMTFPMFIETTKNTQESNVTYDDATSKYDNQSGSVYFHKSQDRNFVTKVDAAASNRPQVTDIDEEFLKIFNEAVTIVNEKVVPSPNIAPQLF